MGNTIPSLFPHSFTTEKHEANAFPLSDVSLNLYTIGMSAGHSEDLRVCSEAVLHKFRYTHATSSFLLVKRLHNEATCHDIFPCYCFFAVHLVSSVHLAYHNKGNLCDV